MSREEAAARNLHLNSGKNMTSVELAKYALAAADAHDLAHGVHRIVLDDATEERAARALARHKWPTAIGVWDSFGQGMKDDFRDQVRAVLAAVIQEGP